MKGKVDSNSMKLGNAAGIDISRGYLNINDGRVRLSVKKKYPGAQPSGGYALRSRIVWWLNTGEIIKGLKFNIHHKNGNRADDRFENLEKIDHADHSRQHNPFKLVARRCIRCSKQFQINGWRLKEKSRGKFCSQECYHASRFGLVTRFKVKCKKCGKTYEVIKSRIKKTKYCSATCLWKRKQ
jgi:hypothetical protein